mmetsp:Transcript_47920/g.133570  ORF Transcript_47920/g.133570 Transcript_47920/m.133570 type:complete len:202 (+) Transcript_47920:2039-2644(+)
MWVSVDMLSSGSFFRRAVTCLIAVRNEVGLKRPGIQRLNGRVIFSVHFSSASQRRIASGYHVARAFIEGHANFSHEALWNGLRPGTWLMLSADDRSSIFCVMFSWPARPFCSSSSEMAISPSSRFMRPHSCTATSTYGWCSLSMSGSAFSSSVIMPNCGGNRSRMSAITASTPPPSSPPPPPEPALSRRIVSNTALVALLR